MHRAVLGHIDCPTCKSPAGMRITEDRNGNPFGFCEAKCGQQLPIGIGRGGPYRVAEFYAANPGIKKPGTDTDDKPAPTSVPEPKKTPPAAPAQPTRRSIFGGG